MLAVVHELAGEAIDERGGAAAKLWTRVEDEDPRAGGGELRGRREPREAGADDRNVWSQMMGRSLSLSVASAFRRKCNGAMRFFRLKAEATGMESRVMRSRAFAPR
jgi:hypothetical protein